MGASYEIARDLEYIRRRAVETGFMLQLVVSSRGFTIQALRDGRAAGSSTYHAASPDQPLPDACFRESVDRAIANANGAL